MTNVLLLLACALTSCAAPDDDADDEPLAVRAQLARGTHYAGEAIELTIAVLAESKRPELALPHSSNFELTIIDTNVQPISATGIGDQVQTSNVFRYRYRLIAHRAGELTLPPVKATVAGRSGASAPLRFKVDELPAAGRPSSFLGGVGGFELSAEADPTAVPLGESFEFRIRMTGPAARGSRATPAVALTGKVSGRPTVEPLASALVADPPARVFRYGVRPARAGEVVLPPVAVAAFDPRASRYVTKVTPGVRVRVADVPRFTRAQLKYGPGASAQATRSARGGVPPVFAYAGIGIILVALGLLVRLARAPRAGPDRARLAASRRARAVPAGDDGAVVARWINEALLEYLRLAVDRAPGALTPAEAEDALVAATGDAELADQARRLTAWCDQTLYGSSGPAPDTLADAAKTLFGTLGERSTAALRKTERGSPDREVG